MILTCKACGKPYSARTRKGLKYVPEVCSKECFFTWILNSRYTEKSFIPYAEQNYNKNGNFKSPAEVIVFNRFKKEGINVQYEPYILKTADYMYIPDFFLPDYNIFLEVKGKWNYSNYTKFTAFATKLPLFLFDIPFLKRILKWL